MLKSICKTKSVIKLLIGFDVARKLLTRNIKVLKSGPFAIKIHLGWTLMGKILGVKIMIAFDVQHGYEKQDSFNSAFFTVLK